LAWIFFSAAVEIAALGRQQAAADGSHRPVNTARLLRPIATAVDLSDQISVPY
jgi:hypothetical protein